MSVKKSRMVVLTLSALRGAGVPRSAEGPGVRTPLGVRPAGVRAPDDLAVPERLVVRNGLGVGASVSSVLARGRTLVVGCSATLLFDVAFSRCL